MNPVEHLQIKSKADFRDFIRADEASMNRRDTRFMTRAWFVQQILKDDIWEFQITMRRLELLKCQSFNLFRALFKVLLVRKFRNLSCRCGFSIPPNVFGPGLAIPHRGTIIVNDNAKIGANCRIHACVNIGTEAGKIGCAPTIGDNVYIGPGAKIYGAITIADGCVIGANAVVNKSFLEPRSVIAGVPAKVIGQVDSSSILVQGTELVSKK
jgi:serine O-acetyltransferase